MKIEHIEDEGVDESSFGDLIFEAFTAQLSNGVEVRRVLFWCRGVCGWRERYRATCDGF